MDAPRALCILDSSVLINFLAVDRVDLLATHPRYRFVITPHVRDEVTMHYAEQLDRLHVALATGSLEVTRVEAIDELSTFATLESDGFGVGESAAIAAAVNRKLPIALQDKNACKRALKISRSLVIVATEDIILDHLRQQLITLEVADGLKTLWETEHRFRMKVKSFADLLTSQ